MPKLSSEEKNALWKELTTEIDKYVRPAVTSGQITGRDANQILDRFEDGVRAHAPSSLKRALYHDLAFYFFWCAAVLPRPMRRSREEA